MSTQRSRSESGSRSGRSLGLVLGLLVLSVLAPAETRARAQEAAQAPAPAQVPLQAPAPTAPYYAPVRPELFAANLGIYYRLEPYGSSQGARLTRHPVAGSPTAQIQLEPGDMIVALDAQPIQGPNDLLNHTAQTSVQFVNIRTGRPQVNWVFIPPPGPAPGPGPGPGPGPAPGPFPPPFPDPGFGPLPYTLGVATQLTAVSNNQVYAAPVPGLPAPRLNLRPIYGLQITQVVPGSAAQRSGLEVGDTIMRANGVPMTDSNALRRAISSSGGVLNLIVRDVRNPGSEVPVSVRLAPSGGQIYASPVPTPTQESVPASPPSP